LILESFLDMIPGSAAYALVGSSQLVPANGHGQPIVCPDQDFICQGIYPISPTVVPDPTWPIPFPYSNGHADVTLFLDLRYDEPLNYFI
jgi:hypothetical protein